MIPGSSRGIQSIEIDGWETNPSIYFIDINKKNYLVSIIGIGQSMINMIHDPWTVFVWLSIIDNHTKTVHGLLSVCTATSNRHHANYLSDHLPFLGSPKDEIGKTIILTQSSQAKSMPLARLYSNYPLAHHCLFASWYIYMSTQEEREEALLNIRCIVKGYHLCGFEVNVSEVFTANQKRRRTWKHIKVVNHCR